MTLTDVRRLLRISVAVLAVCSMATEALAQAPGAPQVTVLPDNVAVISYDAPIPPPAGTLLVATYNGAPIGPFPIGTATAVSSGTPLPPGTYTVQVVWGAGVVSPVTSFVVTGSLPITPGPTTLQPAVLTGNTVTLNWEPSANATAYDLEARAVATGQTFSLQVGNQTTFNVPDVPFGNYVVRVRGRNAFGVGPFSPDVLVSISPTFRLRDLEVTLTWNSQSDIDLHVIEPNGRHVWWRTPRGSTAQLDVDNTLGFGPEVVTVPINGGAPGVYQIFLVHYRGAAPTTATVAVSLGVGTPNVKTAVFTRQTTTPSATVGYNVALVDVKSGVIGEEFGTRETAPADARPKP
jgi:hypothetical protein